jgi:hypothetical protein
MRKAFGAYPMTMSPVNLPCGLLLALFRTQQESASVTRRRGTAIAKREL